MRSGSEEHHSGDVDAFLKLAAESARRIQADAEAMAERVRSEAAAFVEEQLATARRVSEVQRTQAEAV